MSEQTSHERVDRDGRAFSRLMLVLVSAVVAAAVALFLSQLMGLHAAFGIGSLIFLASFACGCFLGFLFGVPRVLSKEQATASDAKPIPGATGTPAPGLAKEPEPQEATTTANTKASARLLQSNTNLERLSDWLTTMLVGAGLVELHKINDGLVMFRQFLEESARVFPGVNGHPSAGAIPLVGPIILVFGAACGFLYMYLNTRLVLVRLFDSVERELSGALPTNTEMAVKALANKPVENGEVPFVAQQLTAKESVTVGDAIRLMLDLLYKSNPDRVIELGAQISATEANKRADYWFYLAAAFGQKMLNITEADPGWLSAKDNALDCARRAVAIDGSYRTRLWNISDPESYDNDLSKLRDDPEFRRIVDR